MDGGKRTGIPILGQQPKSDELELRSENTDDASKELRTVPLPELNLCMHGSSVGRRVIWRHPTIPPGCVCQTEMSRNGVNDYGGDI